jgi:rhomboid protease GluP
LQPLNEILDRRVPKVWITKLLIILNSLVFIAMLIYGAGLWHSPNGVQLTWGANFGPATQDGQWWRLASAMFLHFGALHLLLNMWALWDAGQLVERMYGHVRFTCIYLVSGLFGNLVSLVFQGNSAVSGGASGAIFGIYGALLIYLWFNRLEIHIRDFRWLFWGAITFSLATIVFGFIVPGIDNSAHIGGFTAGILTSIFLLNPININVISKKLSLGSLILLVLMTFMLYLNMPKPKYLWSDEILLQNEINEFTFQEQEINRSWLEILHDQKKSGSSLNELAGKVESKISEPYEDSFEKLSQLPSNSSLPSAVKLKSLITYTKQRKEESKALADKLREQELKTSK